MAKIERKYMAHYIDSSMGGTASYTRLGKDLEELNIEMNPDVEIFKNILGEQSVKHNGYEVSATAEPFYADESDDMFEPLQEIVDDRKMGDDCKTTVVEVHLWDETQTTGTYVAYREDCYVVPTSYGGDTSGYQIPFEINYAGNRVKGKFALSTKTFTPDT